MKTAAKLLDNVSIVDMACGGWVVSEVSSLIKL